MSDIAPKSFVKLASGVTSDSSTPNLSIMIDFTFCAISDIFLQFGLKIMVQRNTLNP
jgi:hypothetical protein